MYFDWMLFAYLIEENPGPGRTHTISTDGGRMPRWSHDGRELFYLKGDKLMVVDIQTKPAFQATIPKVLFTRNEGECSPGYRRHSLGDVYEVMPDGKHFLMLKPGAEPQAQPDQLHVIVNWFEERRRRAPLEMK